MKDLDRRLGLPEKLTYLIEKSMEKGPPFYYEDSTPFLPQYICRLLFIMHKALCALIGPSF